MSASANQDPIDVIDKSALVRGRLVAGYALLAISALPDAMVVPVLKQLLVDRYGVDTSTAHLFMSVNILGAFLAAGTIIACTRKLRLTTALCLAALLNASLLALMAMPIGFIPTLLVRTVEGTADLTVYALLFNFISRSGPAESRGRRMGLAATCMMLGIAGGIAAGGFIGATHATMTLWVGAGLCLIVAFLAMVLLGRTGARGESSLRHSPSSSRSCYKKLWPALLMMMTDRAVGGLLAITIPLYLATTMGFDSKRVGMLVGTAMLGLALGAWPAGRLVDRLGVLRTRLAASILYAGGFALIPFAVPASSGVASVVFLLTGLGGAALFASSLVLVCQRGQGSDAMGAYHAAGNLGFFLGPLGAAALLRMLGGSEPDAAAFASVMIIFAMLHAVFSSVAMVAAMRIRVGRVVAETLADPVAA